MKLLGSHVSSTSAYTLAVKKITASDKIMFTCTMGMRAEFGVDSMMMSGSRFGWNRSDVCFSLGGLLSRRPSRGCCFAFFADGNAASLEVCKDLLDLLLLLLAAMPPPSELEVHHLKLVIHSPFEVDCSLRTCAG